MTTTLWRAAGFSLLAVALLVGLLALTANSADAAGQSFAEPEPESAPSATISLGTLPSAAEFTPQALAEFGIRVSAPRLNPQGIQMCLGNWGYCLGVAAWCLPTAGLVFSDREDDDYLECLNWWT